MVASSCSFNELFLMNYFQVYALMNLNVLIALGGIFKPNLEALKLNCNP